PLARVLDGEPDGAGLPFPGIGFDAELVEGDVIGGRRQRRRLPTGGQAHQDEQRQPVLHRTCSKTPAPAGTPTAIVVPPLPVETAREPSIASAINLTRYSPSPVPEPRPRFSNFSNALGRKARSMPGPSS